MPIPHCMTPPPLHWVYPSHTLHLVPHSCLYSYEVRKEFFPPDVFLAMKARLVNSDLAMAENALNGESFGKTRGLISACPRKEDFWGECQ